MSGRTRGYAHRIHVGARVSAVWSALTTSASLDAWCSAQARIDARPGGSLLASVDQVTEFEAVIDVFVPERRLRLIHLPSTALPPTDYTVIDDFFLEADESATILRLLGSGMPSDSRWDEIYLQRRRGWGQALTRLKVYCERDAERSTAR